MLQMISFRISSVVCPVLLGVILTFSSCEKDEDAIMTDIDGNEYHTVKIGQQVWMAENLRTTHYRNGDIIPGVEDAAAWDELVSGGYCDFDNDPSNAATFGHLYNWYAVNDTRNLCPPGWHVPTDDEWSVLVEFLGGEEVAGGKLKGTDTTFWHGPNTGATHETGFSGLPGGCRRHDGPFHYWTYYGFWWTATEEAPELVLYRSLVFDTPAIFRNHYGKDYGLSVRCVKD